MTADTTQPAGALPEPSFRGTIWGDFYTAVRAMMAERDAAREERDAALERAEFCLSFTRDAQTLCATTQAEAAALRRELEELRAIPPDAREGREPLTLPEIKALSNAVDVAWSAGRHEGNWDEMFARAIEAALGIGPAGTSADGETQP